MFLFSSMCTRPDYITSDYCLGVLKTPNRLYVAKTVINRNKGRFDE